MSRSEFPTKGNLRVPMHEYNNTFLILWSPQRFANVNVLPPTHDCVEDFSCGSPVGVQKSTQDHA